MANRSRKPDVKPGVAGATRRVAPTAENVKITYQWLAYDQLSADQLHDILALRQAVFIVEQRCPYLDIDGLDRHAWHLLGRDADGALVAYLRAVQPGSKYPEPSIGRVVTHPNVRDQGIGRELMTIGIENVEKLFPGSPIRLSAQVYARGFYQSFGFETAGQPYDEDGIPHVEMLRIPEKESTER